MAGLLIFIVSASLFDSFSTGIQLIFFVLLLTSASPVRNALVYLAGLFFSYLICGIAGYLNIGSLNALISAQLPQLMQLTDSQYYTAQGTAGLLCALAGAVYYVKTKRSTKPPVISLLMAYIHRITPFWAAGIGIGISVTGFPAALPYIGVLEKIYHAEPGTASALLLVTFYNFVYLLPMLVPFALFLRFRHSIENFEHKLQKHADHWNRTITVVLFCGVGALFAGDSLLWLFTGHGLFPAKILI